MMLYCERCSALYEEKEACPFCKRHMGRAPQPDDPCFLVEEGFVWSEILADVFRQENIPFIQRQAVGVAPLVGVNLARYRFYTPFSHLDQAQAVADDVLSPADDEANDESDDDELLSQ